MFKKVLFLILMLAVPFCLMAQSSGKIMGMVTDSETGEPLPGVNVILQNTFLGATTDIDGYYVILNVPVGPYTIEASYVGYSKYIIQNIRVSADLTTQQDYQLSPTTLELGEAVIVVADRPLVEKHVTHSASKITGEELANVPIRGLNALMAYMPSVVVQNGAVNIRGGRGEEVGYYLDGASTMNPMNRTNAVHVIQEAMEEAQVLTGGFGAEYGNANSGIVKSQLKSGTSKWQASLMAETDKFASEGNKFLGTYSYQDHIIVGTVGGPITKNIRFFIAGENESIGDNQKRFSNGYSFSDRIDTNPDSKFVTAGHPDTVNITYPDGFTPNNYFDRYALNATISFNYNPIRFRLSAVYNHSEQVGTNNPMRSYLDNRWATDLNDHLLLTGKFTHIINSKTYYDINLSGFIRNLDEEDPYFGNDWMKWADSAAVSQATGETVTYRNAYQAEYNYRINGINFTRPGGHETYQKSKQFYYSGGLDFVSQINKNHELRFGLNAKFWEIRQYSVNPRMIATIDDNWRNADGSPKEGYYEESGDLAKLPYIRHSQYTANTFGYDHLGNETDKEGFDGARKPIIGGVYLSDKIEYEDLVINAGLRFDYFDADDYKLKNPEDPKPIDAETNILLPEAWEKVKAHMHVSPRLGIAFPVSETTKFYTQYGKYVQMPEFNDFYYNDYQYGRQIASSGFFYLTPVGAGFDPIFTTAYEIGFNKQLGDYAAIDIAGFYKNVKGQIMTTRVVPAATSSLGAYNALVNGDFATSRGLEFKLTMRRYNRIQGQINYTYTSAEGTGSGETSYISATDRTAQVPTILSPLDYSQKHRGSVILDYRFGKGEGGPVFQEFGVNMMFRFNSGHPYTYAFNSGGQSDPYTGGVDYMRDTRARKVEEPINSSVTPWTSNVDLKIDKSFNIIDQLRATVYVRITNLFNTQNVINVYHQTGSDTDDGYITDWNQVEPNFELHGGEEYIELYKAINTVNGSSYLSQLGLDLWDHPRQIMFGIKLNY